MSVAGGKSTGLVGKRKLGPGMAYGAADGAAPYELKRGDCGRVGKTRDEWQLLVADPSVLHYMSSQVLRKKLLEAARVICAERGKR